MSLSDAVLSRLLRRSGLEKAAVDELIARSGGGGGGESGGSAPSALARCEYRIEGASMPAAASQFDWVDWADGLGPPYDIGFRPLDVTDPQNPAVISEGVYAVNVLIKSGPTFSTSLNGGTTHAGATMSAALGLDDDGYGWYDSSSVSLDAGGAPTLSVGNTAYFPAGGVIRLYFAHTAPDPSVFTMYATVQRVA